VYRSEAHVETPTKLRGLLLWQIQMEHSGYVRMAF